MVTRKFVVKIIVISLILIFCVVGVFAADNVTEEDPETYTQVTEKPRVITTHYPTKIIVEPSERRSGNNNKETLVDYVSKITPVPVITYVPEQEPSESYDESEQLTTATPELEDTVAEEPETEQLTPEDIYVSEESEDVVDENVYYEESADVYIEDTVEDTSEVVYTGEIQEEIPIDDGAPNMEYLGNWKVTFYCNCEQCCGVWAGGATASGDTPSPWYTVATGDLPFGTSLHIDGLGDFVVQDRGTNYGHVDVFVSSHEEALACGEQWHDVYIVY